MDKLLRRWTNQINKCIYARMWIHLAEKRIPRNDFVKSGIWNLKTFDQSQSSKATIGLPDDSLQNLIREAGAQASIDEDVGPGQQVAFHSVSERNADRAHGKKLEKRKITQYKKEGLVRWPCVDWNTGGCRIRGLLVTGHVGELLGFASSDGAAWEILFLKS